MGRVVKIPGPWPFQGRIVWLTPEQGGRESGPPEPSDESGYAHTAFVPPRTAQNGLASFALRGFDRGAWTSFAEGRWLIVDNTGDQRVEPGSVVACTEGARVVAYFHVEMVRPRDDRGDGSAFAGGRFAEVATELTHPSSHRELAVLVEAMLQDLSRHPGAWENATLSAYLEALSAFVDAVDQLSANRGEALPDQPTWELVGELLLGATGYE